MFCPSCKAVIPDDSIFCNKCGTKISVVSSVPEEKQLLPPLDLLSHNSDEDAAVSIGEALSSDAFMNSESKLSFAIGKDQNGNMIVGDLKKAIHILVSGTTGMGKSAFLHSLIVSLLYKATPDDVRFVLIDFTGAELSMYNGLPHLNIPVISDVRKCDSALLWVTIERTKRLKMFSDAGVSNIESYNRTAEKRNDSQLPRIVVIIDGLMNMFPGDTQKNIEESIRAITQSGRVVGIHLVIATPRPSSRSLADLLKASFPTRICFGVTGAAESKYVLNRSGAEKLSRPGDLLYLPLGSSAPVRTTAAYVSDADRNNVLEYLKTHEDPLIVDRLESWEDYFSPPPDPITGAEENGYDELLPQAVDVILETKQASVSMLQRRLKLGYARAARIVDQMEEIGVVGPYEGSNPRQILISRDEWMENQDKLLAQESDAHISFSTLLD